MAYTSGVYQIRNKVNDKKYIGSSVNVRDRWRLHLSHLQRQIHGNVYLQRAWNKYGVENFDFTVLIYCDPENTLIYEQACLEGLKPEYNIATDARAPTKGMKASDETRRKMSETHSGKNHPNYGKKMSDEFKKKNSTGHLGQVAWNKGMIGSAMSGRTGEEHPMYGFRFSEERKQKFSEDRKGENAYWYGKKRAPVSEETRRKLSEATTRVWAMRRGEL